MSNTIKIFLEYHYFTVRPSLKFKINSVEVTPNAEEIASRDGHDEIVILNFDHELADQNIIEIELYKKFNGSNRDYQDLKIDQLVDIDSLEIDGIRIFTQSVKNSWNVNSTLSSQWVEELKMQGIVVDQTHKYDYRLEFDCIASLAFSMPVWKWYTEQLWIR